MLYSWGQSLTRTHRFCWIIWRSHATKPPFFAGLNQAYNSAESRASFFVYCVINNHVVNENIILQMRFDAFLAIQMTPNTLVTRDHMFVYVCVRLCVQGGSGLFIQTFSQHVTKQNWKQLSPSHPLLPLVRPSPAHVRLGWFIMLLSRINWSCVRGHFLQGLYWSHRNHRVD